MSWSANSPATLVSGPDFGHQSVSSSFFSCDASSSAHGNPQGSSSAAFQASSDTRTARLYRCCLLCSNLAYCRLGSRRQHTISHGRMLLLHLHLALQVISANRFHFLIWLSWTSLGTLACRLHLPSGGARHDCTIGVEGHFDFRIRSQVFLCAIAPKSLGSLPFPDFDDLGLWMVGGICSYECCFCARNCRSQILAVHLLDSVWCRHFESVMKSIEN